MSFLGARSVFSFIPDVSKRCLVYRVCEASQRNVVTSGPYLQGFCHLSSGDGSSTER